MNNDPELEPDYVEPQGGGVPEPSHEEEEGLPSYVDYSEFEDADDDGVPDEDVFELEEDAS